MPQKKTPIKRSIKKSKPAAAPEKIKKILLSDLRPNPDNPRFTRDDNYKKLKRKIQKRPHFLKFLPIVYDEKKAGMIISGNLRHQILLDLGYHEIPEEWVRKASDLTDEERDELILWANQHEGEYDFEKLANLFSEEQLAEANIFIPNFSTDEEASNPESISEKEKKQEARAKLQDRFIVPPFSVFNTSQGYWQERRRAWLDSGIASAEGRDDNLLSMSDAVRNPDHYRDKESGEESKSENTRSGTSIFDPVLCEIVYKWFHPGKGIILDPFAGGSVRGLVASLLDLKYIGIDLRKEQINANRKNAKKVLQKKEIHPEWIEGDSADLKKLFKSKADLIFSCPPYHDLEKYSDDPRDLSNINYESFIKKYRAIILQSIEALNDDSFAVFVCGEIRNKKGFYKNFIADTIDAFESVGANYYNEIILYNTIAGAAIRADKIFNGGRKIVKVHQNILVFFKGDPKKIKAKFPAVEVDNFPEEEGAEIKAEDHVEL